MARRGTRKIGGAVGAACADLACCAAAILLASLVLRAPVSVSALGAAGAAYLLTEALFALFGVLFLPRYGMNVPETARLSGALAAGCAAGAPAALLPGWLSPPRYLLFYLLFAAGALLRRLCVSLLRSTRFRLASAPGTERVMVVGAGVAGGYLVREMRENPGLRLTPVCAIDDDPAKARMRLSGVPVVGGREAIPAAAERYAVQRIIVAIPSASGEVLRELCRICADTGRRVQILPEVSRLLFDTVMTRQARDIEFNDLLGRKPVEINDDEVRALIGGRVILVTGGGGSIGSELCRQIAAREPARLVIFDIYENNAYDIQQELRRLFPRLDLSVRIGSVRDAARVRAVFAAERPDVVFHAAAHKHVPLMEENPGEAVRNNVFGTWNVAEAAAEAGTGRFVLISTDKAVNPTNVMGATKRVCEMIVRYFSHRAPRTEYAAVRFGNVLGTNGSVIPLFRKQIAAGGPVTVTHRDIIRYFMTVSEAVSLVLQAGAFAKGGEIFVLDMGEPVRILTLAENLIRLSGFRPYEDIPIVFTGLRPGEKLYEEPLTAEEGLSSTANRTIRIGRPLPFDEKAFMTGLDDLRRALDGSDEDVLRALRALVPTYRPDAAPRPYTPPAAQILQRTGKGTVRTDE